MAVETKIEFPGADGAAEAYLYTPSQSGRWPGVVHLTDIMGIRPANRGMAARQADMGYTVVLPNIYYRTSKLPVLDFTPQMGEERTMKKFGELRASLPPDAMTRDGATYAASLLARSDVRGSKLAVIGYCFTGAMALRAAAAAPDRYALAASFHGGGLATDQPDSPHLLLPKIMARLYFGHAVEDRSMPKEMIEKLDAALAQWGGQFESETYDAHHGWTVPGVPAFDAAQAERHFEKVRELLGETMG